MDYKFEETVQEFQAVGSGTTYIEGRDGRDGKDGRDGTDGKTPIRGIDYWTEADKEEIIADIPKGIDDVQINGESIVVDGVAEIDKYGFVKSAMCDGIGAEWTDAEKAAARERIGLGGEWESIFDGDIDTATVIELPSPKKYNSICCAFYCVSSDTLSGASGAILLKDSVGNQQYINCTNCFTNSRTTFMRIENKNGFTFSSVYALNGDYRSIQFWTVSSVASVGAPTLFPKDRFPSSISMIRFSHNNGYEFSGHLQIWGA